MRQKPGMRVAATTPAAGPEPGSTFGQGKSVPLIAMAHQIPYVATASVAWLRDLEAKVTRAMAIRGARYIHVHVPCPLGWGSATSDTIKLVPSVVIPHPSPGSGKEPTGRSSRAS